MTHLAAFILFASFAGQGLAFSPPHAWAFTGTVIEIRQVDLLGLPAEVARVQSAGFRAWVILRVDTRTQQLGRLSLGNARVGEPVRVSISGPQVFEQQIDWSRCEPAASPVCRLGLLYDDGPLSLDWRVPLSPSNEFIHFGRPNPSWEQALFWKTERLEAISAPQARRPAGHPSPIFAR